MYHVPEEDCRKCAARNGKRWDDLLASAAITADAQGVARIYVTKSAPEPINRAGGRFIVTALQDSAAVAHNAAQPVTLLWEATDSDEDAATIYAPDQEPRP